MLSWAVGCGAWLASLWVSNLRRAHLARTTLDVLHAALGCGERASRLTHVIDTDLSLRNLGWVTCRGKGHRQTVDKEAVLGHLARAREATVHLKQSALPIELLHGC